MRETRLGDFKELAQGHKEPDLNELRFDSSTHVCFPSALLCLSS